MKIYRQGDVSLHEIRELPKEVFRAESNVLALGEVTGHSHRFEEKEIVVFEDRNGSKYVQLLKPAVLVHEEHENIKIDKGLYAVRIEREFDVFSEAIKEVTD